MVSGDRDTDTEGMPPSSSVVWKHITTLYHAAPCSTAEGGGGGGRRHLDHLRLREALQELHILQELTAAGASGGGDGKPSGVQGPYQTNGIMEKGNTNTNVKNKPNQSLTFLGATNSASTFL